MDWIKNRHRSYIDFLSYFEQKVNVLLGIPPGFLVVE